MICSLQSALKRVSVSVSSFIKSSNEQLRTECRTLGLTTCFSIASDVKLLYRTLQVKRKTSTPFVFRFFIEKQDMSYQLKGQFKKIYLASSQ